MYSVGRYRGAQTDWKSWGPTELPAAHPITGDQHFVIICEHDYLYREQYWYWRGRKDVESRWIKEMIMFRVAHCRLE